VTVSRQSALEILTNDRGTAMLETVPLLVIFVVLTSFGMGFFGVVHTAVLHSIAARTYSFETFRQRANLYYFREDGTGKTANKSINFTSKGWRYHAVQHESDQRDKFVATTRPIALGRGVAQASANDNTHNIEIFGILPRNERTSVNPVWVMVGYGICLNAGCGN
jgi:Flp pilus assembly protein TadG